jgi:SOS-response transcriptional repressor LexA
MNHTLPLKSVPCQPLEAFEYTPKRRNHIPMTLAERLKAAREAAGYSQEALAKKIGIVQQSLQKIEAGIIRNPRNLPLIESVLGLPAGYLMYGEEKTAELPKPIIARCPILAWDQAAHWPDNKNEVLNNNPTRLAKNLTLSENCYALQIKDDSMINYLKAEGFHEGRYIIVDPAKEPKENSYVVAQKKDHNDLLFRKFINDAGRLKLSPLNNMNFEKITINEDIQIKGVVVAYVDLFV